MKDANAIITLDCDGKTHRFLNPVPLSEIKNIRIPRNCSVVTKREAASKNLKDMFLVNDGFVPVFFNKNCEDPYKNDCKDAKLLVITLMIVTEYCNNDINKKCKESIVRQAALNEKLETLEKEASDHQASLNAFMREEKERENFFSSSDSIFNKLENLQTSKKRVLEAVSDVKISMDKIGIKFLEKYSNEL